MMRRPLAIGGVWVEARTPADEDLLTGAQAYQVGGVGRTDLAQESVVVLHQVLGDVDAEGAQLGAQGFASGHLRQAARLRSADGVRVDGQLALARRSGAGGPVEFGDLQQQIASREASVVEGVQGADLRQAFGDRPAGTGPLPEVRQRSVR